MKRDPMFLVHLTLRSFGRVKEVQMVEHEVLFEAPTVRTVLVGITVGGETGRITVLRCSRLWL